MTRGFFDYEAEDEEPRTYYDSRVAKAKREGTWTRDMPSGPKRPKGAATATAAQSFWTAILWTALGVPRMILTTTENVGSMRDVDWLGVGLAMTYVVLAAVLWNSWRILRRYEAEHGKPEGQGPADRRAKVTALVIVALVAVGFTVLTVLEVVGVID